MTPSHEAGGPDMMQMSTLLRFAERLEAGFYRAERVGFEPTDSFRRHLLSREARSTGLRHLSRC